MSQSRLSECMRGCCLRIGVGLGLRRMQWRKQILWEKVKDGKKRIAEVVRSKCCSFQGYCDALVDEVWMVKEVESQVLYAG